MLFNSRATCRQTSGVMAASSAVSDSAGRRSVSYETAWVWYGWGGGIDGRGPGGGLAVRWGGRGAAGAPPSSVRGSLFNRLPFGLVDGQRDRYYGRVFAHLILRPQFCDRLGEQVVNARGRVGVCQRRARASGPLPPPCAFFFLSVMVLPSLQRLNDPWPRAGVGCIPYTPHSSPLLPTHDGHARPSAVASSFNCPRSVSKMAIIWSGSSTTRYCRRGCCR
jgi:hypothetical protein